MIGALFRSLVCAAALVMCLPATSAPAQGAAVEAQVMVVYVPPVDGPVVDPFRPPAHIGAPGNRGLEYGNQIFVPVVAAADGEVIFAGSVVGAGVATILHADGVRTTYTGMTDVWTGSGALVRQGEAIGLAGRNVHFGALIRDHYLDPQILIDASQGSARPRLVPAPNGP